MKLNHIYRCDVTKSEDLVSLYDGCEDHFKGKVVIFCNNAGIIGGWRKCMEIDIVSCIAYQLYFVPSCVAR